jgi:hypothetical protein
MQGSGFGASAEKCGGSHSRRDILGNSGLIKNIVCTFSKIWFLNPRLWLVGLGERLASANWRAAFFLAPRLCCLGRRRRWQAVPAIDSTNEPRNSFD